MNFTVFTLFPSLFPGPLGISVIGKALEKGLWSLKAVDIRNFASDKHRSVDDYPAGGGAGMVLKPDVLSSAIKASVVQGSRLIYLSPRGRLFNQKLAVELVQHADVALICGRFEGVDQRVLDHHAIEEISIGDYVLAGGEVAAMVLMESCVRLVPGVLGAEASANEDSFAPGTDYEYLLEYDQYTRPASWGNAKIPDVLLGGNHGEIRKWRLQNAQDRTKRIRPDLLMRKRLQKE